MKKEEKKVAKLAKKSKVDSKKVIITNEMSKNYMSDKIEKKKSKKEKLTKAEHLQQKIDEAGLFKFKVEEPKRECIEIKLKNLTDEKLKNVFLFDHQNEHKDMVEYSSPTFSLGIKEFLRQLSSIQRGKYVIKYFKYNASCDLERFAIKQTNAYITTMYSDLTGRIHKIPHRPDHLKNNHHRHFENLAYVTTDDEDLSFYSNLSLSLEYLMPETTVSVLIMLEKIDKQ